MKRKNGSLPSARRAFIVLILLFLLFAAGFGFFNQSQASLYAEQTQSALNDFYQGTASRQGRETATESAYLTAATALQLTQAPLDNTAIAQFTQNPSLALSSTPYFVEILARDFWRRITTTPTNGSLPVMSSWVRADESDAFIEILREHNIEATLMFSSTGMEGINQTDLKGFQVFETTLHAGIDRDDLSDETLTPIFETFLSLLIENEPHLDGIAFHNLDIIITFYDRNDETHAKTIHTMLHTAKEAQKMGLAGEALIEYLGGFTTNGE